MQILDCTLRDGGYYTNWDFSKSVVATYFDAMNQLPVDYLEIGYRNNPMKEYLGEYFYCPDYVLQQAKTSSNKKLVIILDEKNVLPEHVDHLLKPCVGLIDMVRIALDPQQLTRALKLAEKIKTLGFQVGFNVMYMSKWGQYTSFIEELKYVDSVADYFYMVDSYGGVYPNDVIKTIELVKAQTNCKIGFHGHNNIELGLINSLTAIEHGASIIDATITGMGRGAGNLKTELLLTSLNARNGLDVNFNALSTVVDSFEKLQQHYGWGTNLPYMVSGANSLPQKDVMEWVTKKVYSFNSIIRALQNQKEGVEDNEQLPLLKPLKKYDTVLIIGGGTNALAHFDGIKNFILQQPNVCLVHASSKNASNFSSLTVDQYFCLVGNEGHRLEKVFTDLVDFNGVCVLPPYPRKMGTYVPAIISNHCFELPNIQFTKHAADTHTAIALQTAVNLDAKQIFLVGYDGYQDGVLTQQERSLSDENELLFKAFKVYYPTLTFSAITPTRYASLETQSLYALLS